MKKFVLFLVFICCLFLVSCGENPNGGNEGNPTVTEKISIMFDGNGGTLVSGKESQKIEKPSDIVPPTYEREGYTFKGWNVDLTTITADKIVKAEWQKIGKKVTFDSNGGTLTSEEMQIVEVGKQISIPSDPMKEGYTFDGWYLGTEKWSFKSDIVTIDLTLTAHWKINQYTLTIKFDDGITPDKVITQDYNSAITKINEPTREHYTFLGWSSPIPEKMPAKDRTILATWKINQYTLTIKYNDGITPDKTLTQDFNTKIIIENPIRTGYTFDKWSETISVMPAENKIIEAIWKANQYSITLKYNDGITPDKVITQDYNTVVMISNPIRTGYIFDKWSETISVMPAENKIIEAIWKANKFHITLKFNDEITPDKIIEQDCGTTINISNPTRSGYTFEKWSEVITTMPAENKTIYATWKINQYTLTIKFDDGVTPDKVITQDYMTPININLTTPLKLGYTFEKWSETIPVKMPAENKIIYSNWICDVKYSIVNNVVKITGYNKNNNIVVLDKYENKTTNEIGDSAFRSCKSLTNITIPDSVTIIGDNAFNSCTSLTNITIPDNLISIGDGAFINCTSLTNIIIPDNVTSIGRYAFSGCIGLTNITIPDGVTIIKYRTFEGCKSLSNVTISDKVITIESGAFQNCTSLSNVTIPDKVITIGSEAFVNCKSFTNITIPDSVTFIGESAFSCCENVSNIKIGNNVTTIGRYAFSGKFTTISLPNSVTSLSIGALLGCSYVTTIKMPFSENTVFKNLFTATFDGAKPITSIPSSLKEVIITKATKLADGAFMDCTGLTSITIPNSVTSIGEDAFYNCTGLTSITIPNSVTSIGEDAFYNCTGLTSITIPDTVTSIGLRAFEYCTGLTSITIPNSVTSIGDGAFINCTGLTSIIIPDSVTSIGEDAFYKCTGLTSITLPFVGDTLNGTTKTHFAYIFGGDLSYIPSSLKEVIITNVTSIANSAFYNCTGLTSITIPNSVTSIGEDAFSYCTGLTSITIPESVTSIGEHAFLKCTGLTSITIPDSVTSIGEYTFSNCTGLTSIIIPDSVTSIGEYAFFNCTGLTSIIIPDSVTSIGEYAFYKCTGLTSITLPFVGDTLNGTTETDFEYIFGGNSSNIPSSLKEVIITNATSIGIYAFYGCHNLTSITIPDTVTSIGLRAFEYCTGLTSITIPNSVTSIGEHAFSNCTGLTSIIIPDSVTSIGEHAFYKCTGLTSITIPNSVTSIGEYAFSNCTGLTIYCEASSKPSGWGYYWNSSDMPVVWGYTGN